MSRPAPDFCMPSQDHQVFSTVAAGLHNLRERVSRSPRKCLAGAARRTVFPDTLHVKRAVALADAKKELVWQVSRQIMFTGPFSLQADLPLRDIRCPRARLDKGEFRIQFRASVLTQPAMPILKFRCIRARHPCRGALPLHFTPFV